MVNKAVTAPHLDVLDDVSERGGALGPGPHQLHGLVEVSDIVSIHPEEGGVLDQDVTQAWSL